MSKHPVGWIVQNAIVNHIEPTTEDVRILNSSLIKPINDSAEIVRLNQDYLSKCMFNGKKK